MRERIPPPPPGTIAECATQKQSTKTVSIGTKTDLPLLCARCSDEVCGHSNIIDQVRQVITAELQGFYQAVHALSKSKLPKRFVLLIFSQKSGVSANSHNCVLDLKPFNVHSIEARNTQHVVSSFGVFDSRISNSSKKRSAILHILNVLTWFSL